MLNRFGSNRRGPSVSTTHRHGLLCRVHGGTLAPGSVVVKAMA